MGLREATFVTMMLGMLTATTAEAKPTRPAKPADHKAAEAKPPAAPDAATIDAARPDGAGSGGPAEAPAEAAEQVPRHLVGPKHVELGSAASIELPAGYWLFERAEAQDLARKMGNRPDLIVATILKPESD